ncbi:MAG: hypothetical protein ACU84Q_21545 [Gammaproteobacteria bacterium]
MATDNQDASNDIQANQAVFAAVFTTATMAGYLWSQIVTGLVPPVV